MEFKSNIYGVTHLDIIAAQAARITRECEILRGAALTKDELALSSIFGAGEALAPLEPLHEIADAHRIIANSLASARAGNAPAV